MLLKKEIRPTILIQNVKKSKITNYDLIKEILSNLEVIRSYSFKIHNKFLLKFLDLIFRIDSYFSRVPLDEKVYNIDLYFHFDNEVDIKEKDSKLILNNNFSFKISSHNHFKMNLITTAVSKNMGKKLKTKHYNIGLKKLFRKDQELATLYIIEYSN